MQVTRKEFTNKVYLVGSINGISYEESVDWREELGNLLTLLGFNVFSPMRFKETLKGQSNICDSRTLYSPDAILSRDLDDIYQSDIIIANLSTLGEAPCIGSLMELGIALELGKRVILFNVPAGMGAHPFFSKFEVVEPENYLHVHHKIEDIEYFDGRYTKKFGWEDYIAHHLFFRKPIVGERPVVPETGAIPIGHIFNQIGMFIIPIQEQAAFLANKDGNNSPIKVDISPSFVIPQAHRDAGIEYGWTEMSAMGDNLTTTTGEFTIPKAHKDAGIEYKWTDMTAMDS